ncbi:MAG: hypothetical protein SVP26_05820 [Chloroflexota bacterium]|nr:hypothetical protein [Chloroflexota bacterium]
MGDKILEIEHSPGDEWVVRFRPTGLQWLPEETRRHLLGARKEFLLALRSAVDQAIQRTDEVEKPKSTRRTRIKVE